MPPDFLVIDPFCGTGAIGEAALRCGRAYLGADIDDAVLNVAETRLEAVTAGLRKGSYPDERKHSSVSALYVNGCTIHHSVAVRLSCLFA